MVIFEYGNQKSVKVSPTSVSAKIGGTQNLKVTYGKTGKLKKLTSFIRYVSDNPSVAKVSSGGKVTGVSSGSCNIYIFTMNGYQAGVKVTVGEQDKEVEHGSFYSVIGTEF